MKDITTEIKSYLEKRGDQLVNHLKQELIKKKKVATGKTLKSVTKEIVEKGDGRISLKILADEDIAFILGGRKKGLQLPPPQHLEKWAKVRGLKIRDAKSLGFSIARGIKKKGIRGVNLRSWSKRKDQEIYEDVQDLLQRLITDELTEAAVEGLNKNNYKIIGT